MEIKALGKEPHYRDWHQRGSFRRINIMDFGMQWTLCAKGKYWKNFGKKEQPHGKYGRNL
jgi:hypothetical protein